MATTRDTRIEYIIDDILDELKYNEKLRDVIKEGLLLILKKIADSKKFK